MLLVFVVGLVSLVFLEICDYVEESAFWREVVVEECLGVVDRLVYYFPPAHSCRFIVTVAVVVLVLPFFSLSIYHYSFYNSSIVAFFSIIVLYYFFLLVCSIVALFLLSFFLSSSSFQVLEFNFHLLFELFFSFFLFQFDLCF